MPDAISHLPGRLLLRQIFSPRPGAKAAEPRAESSDEALFERVRSGDDHAAFNELLTRYRARVTALVRRMLSASQTAVDPEDVAQEAFIEAYHKRATFRRGAHLRPWLYSIAVNRCLNHLRSLSSDASGELFDEELLPSQSQSTHAADDPAELLMRRIEIDDIERAAALLPPKLRAVLILRYFDGLSYEEIAETCHLPLGTVKTQLFRARAELKRRLINRDHTL